MAATASNDNNSARGGSTPEVLVIVDRRVATAVTAETAPALLHKYLTSEASRKAYAQASRKAMHTTVAAGEQPQGHRPDFVVQLAAAVVEMLVDAGEQYKFLYPYDTVLVADFLDVLATARGRVLRAAQAQHLATTDDVTPSPPVAKKVVDDDDDDPGDDDSGGSGD